MRALLRGFALPTPLALALAFALHAPAQADEQLKSAAAETAEGLPSLFYYSDDCGTEAAEECVLVTLDCSQYTDLALGLNNFEDQVLGRWLISNGAHAALRVGDRSLEFRPIAMRLSDIDPTWDVEFVPVGDALDWLKAWSKDDVVIVEAGEQRIDLPRSAQDVDNLASLVTACTRKQP